MLSRQWCFDDELSTCKCIFQIYLQLLQCKNYPNRFDWVTVVYALSRYFMAHSVQSFYYIVNAWHCRCFVHLVRFMFADKEHRVPCSERRRCSTRVQQSTGQLTLTSQSHLWPSNCSCWTCPACHYCLQPGDTAGVAAEKQAIFFQLPGRQSG